jgi:hypothetical protein
MYLQEILEVTIGLVLMWLVVSLAAMSFQEWISNTLNWRAKYLQKSIQQMLNNDKKDLAARVYAHPLIISLHLPPKRQGRHPLVPSYIPANIFASVLFDVVMKSGLEESPIFSWKKSIKAQIDIMGDPGQRKAAEEDWNHIMETVEQVTTSGAGQSAVDTLRSHLESYGNKYPEAQPTITLIVTQVVNYYKEFIDEENTAIASGADTDLTMRQFRLGLKAIGITHPKLKKALVALLQVPQVNSLVGEGAVYQTRLQLESWFNDAMDRLSGVYKRKAQLTSFLIGLFLALILNLDSINAATSLWREPALRQAIAAQATEYLQQGSTESLDVSSPSISILEPIKNTVQIEMQLSYLNIPFGWVSDPMQTSTTCNLYTPSAYGTDGNPSQIQGVRIGEVCYPMINSVPFTEDYTPALLIKLIGMLITAAAAAQGAPFWFDILKKLVNIRGTGPNPSETTPIG